MTAEEIAAALHESRKFFSDHGHDCRKVSIGVDPFANDPQVILADDTGAYHWFSGATRFRCVGCPSRATAAIANHTAQQLFGR